MQVREVVGSLLRQRGDAAPFRDADSLVRSGRLESLAVLELVTFLESACGLDFARADFDPGDFESVDSILALLASA